MVENFIKKILLSFNFILFFFPFSKYKVKKIKDFQDINLSYLEIKERRCVIILKILVER